MPSRRFLEIHYMYIEFARGIFELFHGIESQKLRIEHIYALLMPLPLPFMIYIIQKVYCAHGNAAHGN